MTIPQLTLMLLATIVIGAALLLWLLRIIPWDEMEDWEE